jgi:hypothetical protein
MCQFVIALTRMHISKEGDPYLRTMLVQGAHYILGPFGEDSDPRRRGPRLAERGGKNAKKRPLLPECLDGWAKFLRFEAGICADVATIEQVCRQHKS